MVRDDTERRVEFAPMTRQERERRALQLLRTARDAARLLDDPHKAVELAEKVAELWGTLAELLNLPRDPVPLSATHQACLIENAAELAVLLRAYNWADEDLATGAVTETLGTEHVGERGAADGFDALGKLFLPEGPAESWAAELVTQAANGNRTMERAVKFGKYVLHPTPLLVLDDITRIVGQAVHSLNVEKLDACVSDLSDTMEVGHLLYEIGAVPEAVAGDDPLSGPADGRGTRRRRRKVRLDDVSEPDDTTRGLHDAGPSLGDTGPSLDDDDNRPDRWDGPTI